MANRDSNPAIRNPDSPHPAIRNPDSHSQDSQECSAALVTRNRARRAPNHTARKHAAHLQVIH